MPITPTEKIWMNGELVPWDDAQIHILTHTLHYGTGVFEGIRAYETDRGPGRVPPDRAHRAAVQLGADHDDGDPVHGRRARAGDEGHRALDRVCRRATSGRSRTTATARWGSTRCRARSTCRSRAGRGARTSATTRSRKGVRMKISSWTRHDHNTMPPLVEDHRQLRELVAGQGRGAEGRLRRGDHAQPRRPRVGVHRREHLRGAARRARSRRRSRPARCRASRRTR